MDAYRRIHSEPLPPLMIPPHSITGTRKYYVTDMFVSEDPTIKVEADLFKFYSWSSAVFPGQLALKSSSSDKANSLFYYRSNNLMIQLINT